MSDSYITFWYGLCRFEVIFCFVRAKIDIYLLNL